MKKLSLVLTLVLFAIGATLAQRTISGKVSDANGVPLIGASILAKGTTTGTVTDVDGNFSLSVPGDATTLVFSYTGFSTREITLGTSNVIDVTMEEAAEQLSEVVVTGLGIRKEKKALGYAVTTLGSKELELRPEADVARVLRGKVPGVDITQTSGLAGSGTNVIIRGYSSITGTNQPLFVVDGVPFNSDTNNDRNFIGGGASASSRFLDLDPNSIAEVSVLKGLSATVLYGEAGRNGVILITTKNGNTQNLNKKMEITVDQQLFATEIASLPDDQDLYGNGFHNTASAAFSNWGAPFNQPGKNGLDAAGTILHPYSRAALRDALPQYQGARYQYKAYDNLQNFFKQGFINNTSLNIANRLSNGTSINFNYAFRDEDGFIETSEYTKHNFGLGITSQLANGLKVNSSFNFVTSDRSAPPSAISFNSGPQAFTSQFSNIFYTPRSVDLLGLEYEVPGTHESIFYRGGNDIQHPIWTTKNSKELETINRFFGNIALNYELSDWLNIGYRFGLDAYSQQQQSLLNKGGRDTPDGLMNTSNRINIITDHLLSLSFDRDLGEVFNLNGTLGANIRRDTRESTFTNSSQQFVYGLFQHDNFIQHVNSTSIQEENLLGAFLSATLGYKNFLYLNAQARNDWTSTLEKGNNTIVYPSASVSFVPTEAFAALQESKILNYMKLRLGYGTSAGYPDPYSTRNILGTSTRVFQTTGGTLLNTNSVDDFFGNPELKPELHKELEAGLEGRFFNNRVGIDLSLYRKVSSDLIINLNLDPSTGGTSTIVNAAQITNKGIELGIDFTPIQTNNFSWTLNGNFTANEPTVDKLREGIEQIAFAGYTDFGNFAVPGRPYGVIYGTPILRDANGNRITAANGRYVAAGAIAELGDPNPDFNMNGGTTLSWKGLSFNMLWTYQQGGTIMAHTPSTLLGRGILQETDFDRFVPVIAPGVNQEGQPNRTQITSTDHYWENGGVFNDEMLAYDATYVKLREASISYVLPKSLLGKTPFGNITITFSGQNIWFRALGVPEGANYDPEVLSLGVGNGRGFEFINVPTARQYGGSIRLTF
ncbi:MAG: SusC/RagA family TonB-linked outer membrane protein [Saprospiraceae bacterium]|nr:SusC/RagA family TonB-linked outer membrane protein [Saprospiraceae bacterium]